MNTLDKIISGITATIKMNDRIEILSQKLDHIIDRIKTSDKEILGIDKRLIRIETFIEIAQGKKMLERMD